MNGNHDEKIIDAFLEEILSGEAPRDLAPEILAKLNVQPAEPHTVDQPQHSTVKRQHAPTVQPIKTAAPAKKSSRRSSLMARLLVGTLAAALLIGLTTSIFYFASSQNQQLDIAEQPSNNVDGAEKSTLAGSNESSRPLDDIEHTQLAEKKQTESDTNQQPQSTIVDPSENIFAPERIANDDSRQPKRATVEPLAGDQLVSFIDQRMNLVWAQHKLASEAIDDDQWCQRVFVVLTGRSASAKELKEFKSWPTKKRRQMLLDEFFGDDKSNTVADDGLLDEFANEWSRKLASSFLGQAVQIEDQNAAVNPATAHLLASLRYAVFHNTSYDRMVRNLLTAEGSIQPLDSEYNGASGFLIRLSDDQGDDSLTKTAARIGQSFLGQRMQCAKCHDDADAELTQRSLHEFAAMLRDYRVIKSGHVRVVRSEVPDQPLFYEAADGRLVAVNPQLENRSTGLRDALADRVLTDSNFDRQAVNIVWSHLFGYGLSQPVGDFGKHNPAVDPELLDKLANQFAAHDYDLRQLVRWILLSEPFNRPSVIRDANRFVDLPDRDGQPLFAHFYPRKNEAASPRNALALVAKAYQENGPSHSAKHAILANVGSSTGNDSIADTTGSLPRGSTRWGVSDSYANTLQEIVDSDMTDSEKIDHLFLLALSRQPSRQERDVCQKLLDGENIDSAQVFQDIWWAISR